MGEAPRLVSGFEGAPWRRRSCGGCCLYGTTPCLLIPGPWNCDSGEQRGPRTRTRRDLKAPPPGGRGHSDQDGPEGPSPGGRGHSDAASRAASRTRVTVVPITRGARSPSKSKGAHVHAHSRGAEVSALVARGWVPKFGGHRVPRCFCVVPATMASSPELPWHLRTHLPALCSPGSRAAGVIRPGRVRYASLGGLCRQPCGWPLTPWAATAPPGPAGAAAGSPADRPRPCGAITPVTPGGNLGRGQQRSRHCPEAPAASGEGARGGSVERGLEVRCGAPGVLLRC